MPFRALFGKIVSQLYAKTLIISHFFEIFDSGVNLIEGQGLRWVGNNSPFDH